MRKKLAGLAFCFSSVLYGGITKINSPLHEFDGETAVFFCGHLSRKESIRLRLENDLGQNHLHENCYCIDSNSEKNPDLCGSILDPEVQEYLRKNGAGKFQYIFVENPPAIGVLERPSFLETAYSMLVPGGVLVLPIDLPLTADKNIIFSPLFDGQDLMPLEPFTLTQDDLIAHFNFRKKLGLTTKAEPLSWQTVEDVRAYQNGLEELLQKSSRFVKTVWPNRIFDYLEGAFVTVPLWPFLPLMQEAFYAKYFEELKGVGFSLAFVYHDINKGFYVNLLRSYAKQANIPILPANIRIFCVSGLLCLSCHCGCEEFSLCCNGIFKAITLRCYKPLF